MEAAKPPHLKSFQISSRLSTLLLFLLLTLAFWLSLTSDLSLWRHDSVLLFSVCHQILNLDWILKIFPDKA